MAQDLIKITGIKVFGFHGVFESEKKSEKKLVNWGILNSCISLKIPEKIGYTGLPVWKKALINQ